MRVPMFYCTRLAPNTAVVGGSPACSAETHEIQSTADVMGVLLAECRRFSTRDGERQ